MSKIPNQIVVALIFCMGLGNESGFSQNNSIVLKQEQTDSSANDKKTIRSTFEKQVQAWNEGNLEKFMETYWKSPELTFSAGGKTTRGWKETLARYKKSYDTREKMGKLTFTDLEITLLGKSSGLALGRWHLERKNDELEGNFSVVLKKMNGRWLIIHDHSSTLETDD